MASTGEAQYPFSDCTLAQRLEQSEARASARFVEAHATVYPESGARWIEVAGAYAMYDGVSSPITQTFCLGMFQPAGAAEMVEIEEFFQERSAPLFHEVSPLADPGLVPLLNARGYQPFEFTSVLYRPIQSDTRYSDTRYNDANNQTVQVRIAGAEDGERWREITVRGWSHYPEIGPFLSKLRRISMHRRDSVAFLAEQGGHPIAVASLCLSGGVALMAGACTVPEARKQGAQLALLAARLRYAAEQGCDIAMICAQPGSASQRNAERNGFRIAYTRVKWRRERT